MTCVVGLVHNNKVYMGGDSGAIGPNFYEIRKDFKVFIKGEFIIGYAGSFRLGDILQHVFKEPKIKTDNLREYMVSSFVKELRMCFNDNEYMITALKEEDSDGEILVGIRGRLFSIEGDYNVGESIRPYRAIGGGAECALGAMYACNDPSPLIKIKTALEAAALVNAVYPPFYILDV